MVQVLERAPQLGVRPRRECERRHPVDEELFQRKGGQGRRQLCIAPGYKGRRLEREGTHAAHEGVERAHARVDKEARSVELVGRLARDEAEEGVGRRRDADQEREWQAVRVAAAGVRQVERVSVRAWSV